MSGNCINCGKANLEPSLVVFTGHVRGETHTVAIQGLKCPNCGYTTIEGSAMPEFKRLLSDAYRKNHGLLTSTEIKQRRQNLEMTQERFADYLGVGIASVKRWEMGKIQDGWHNQLILEKTNRPVHATADLLGFVAFGSTFRRFIHNPPMPGTSLVETLPAQHWSTVVSEYVKWTDMPTCLCTYRNKTDCPEVLLVSPLLHQTGYYSRPKQKETHSRAKHN